MASRTSKRDLEQSLIDERRIDVARQYYTRGNKNNIHELAERWKCSPRTIVSDLQHIRENEPVILKDYLSRVLPNALNKAIFNLDEALAKSWQIIDDSDTSKHDRISAISVVTKATKDRLDIITNNRSVVDTALGEAEAEGKEREQRGEDNNNNELPTEETRTAESNETNAVF